MRKWTPLWLGFCICLPGGLWADGAKKKGLSAIPGEAVALLYAPTVQGLDDAYKGLINDLGLQFFLPPPFRSVTSLIAQYLPMFEGVDKTGTLALVLMPLDPLEPIDSKVALIVPTKDPKSMLSALGALADKEDQWTVNLMGQPTVALVRGQSLVLAKSTDVARAVQKSKVAMSDKLPATELAAFTDMNLALWVNTDQICKTYKSTIDTFVAMLIMMTQGSENIWERLSAERNRKSIESFVDGGRSVSIGLGYPEGGLALRSMTTYKPGSDFARQLGFRSTSDPLLGGLPASKYLVAFGHNMDPEQTKASLQSMDPFFEVMVESEGVNKDRARRLLGHLEESALLATALRGSVEILPAEEEGLLGFSAVLKTTDSKKWLALIPQVVDLSKKLIVEAPSDLVSDEIKQLTRALTYSSEVEEIAGTSIGHLHFDLRKIGKLTEGDLEESLHITGEEGALLRLGAVDGQTIAISFGGGSKKMTRLIATSRSNETPLQNDIGIKRVATRLPERSAFVSYVAVDNIVEAIQKILGATDKGPLPLEMSNLNAPLLLAASSEEGWSQFDVFIPTELLVGIKSASLTLMGSMRGAAAQ